jgi:hypothetical protein
MAGDGLAQIRQEEQLQAAGDLGVEKVYFPNNDGSWRSTWSGGRYGPNHPGASAGSPDHP